MKFLHWLSHKLGFNSIFLDVYVEDGWIVSGHRCSTCNEVRSKRRHMLMSDYEEVVHSMNKMLENLGNEINSSDLSSLNKETLVNFK